MKPITSKDLKFLSQECLENRWSGNFQIDTIGLVYSLRGLEKKRQHKSPDDITPAKKVTINMLSLKPNHIFNPKLANGSSCNGALKPVTKKNEMLHYVPEWNQSSQ